jgi:hypothetical protein
MDLFLIKRKILLCIEKGIFYFWCKSININVDEIIINEMFF